MRKFIMCSLLVTAQLIFVKTAISSVPLYYFDTNTNHWQRYSINIDIVDHVITSGQYAWAANYKTAEVAFFDGQHWTSATKISGMTEIVDEINPAYPLSGEKPFAWLSGKDANGNSVISYFDGNAWSPAQIIKEGKINLHLNVSAGHAWIDYNDDSTHVYKMADSEHPLEWKEVYSHPQNGYSSSALSFDDQRPELVIKKNDDSENTEIIRVDSKGDVTSLIKASNFIFSRFLVKDNYIIHNYDVPHGSSSDTIYSISNDYGNHWVESKVENASGMLYQYNFYQGIICFEDTFNSQTTRYCSNTTTENKWKTYSIPFEEIEDEYQPYTNASGAWLVSSRTNKLKIPKIFHFDVNSGQLTDLQIENSADHLALTKPVARAVGENELITCGVDKKGNVAGFYYDGSKWISEMLNLAHDCHLSYAGGNNPLFVTKDKNIWVY